ncbi:YhjD/YihY/BrkB family envelope integrity protein [Mycoplasmopsis verecunda]|uniref:Membrane protein n=1 Tax=Mycoplasmopsis verecunda TaxID=171291 RepID=A0A1T4KR51_9BACT|nr:YhjD/YihY/BrkB family envelope integrity protein [Mycoplasmopsis verecunda]WPB54692.1 YhjD/YihY/BrkB family envelope integrity protein [Mycoplasmopsis verecunda]SJZ44882.1 membrane protein [Mycoplasmopsis verecunda]
MKWQNKNVNFYTKLTKSRYKNRDIKKFAHQNLILPDRFAIFLVIYEFLIKRVLITFFAKLLLRAKNESENRKRIKVVDNVYNNFTSKEYNFIWLSSAFYLLISFVPVIYIVYILNLFASNIPWFYDFVGKDFGAEFSSRTLGRFLPGSQSYLLNIINDPTATFSIKAILPNLLLFLSSLYISSTGYGKLVASSNYIYEHYKMGTYWGNKIKGLFLVLMVSVLFWAFATADIIIEKKINHSADYWLNIVIYFIITTLFILSLLLMLFKLIPSFKLNFKSIYKGAILSSTPIILLVLLFNTLNQYFNYDKFGGVVGFFFTIAFFINWFVYFMFLGITFNNAYYKNYISTRTINKKQWIF